MLDVGTHKWDFGHDVREYVKARILRDFTVSVININKILIY